MSNARATELKLSRKNTEFDLKNYGETITLLRPTWISVAGGRREGEPTPLTPQQFDVSLSLVSTETAARGGPQNTQTADLMGRWDADIQRGDEFDYNGMRFTVTTVIRRDYAVNCEATTSG
jgi:hypothetical protein